MAVLVTCKNEEDLIKMSANNIIHQFIFQTLKAANYAISGEIRPKFDLVQAYMVVHLICKN